MQIIISYRKPVQKKYLKRNHTADLIAGFKVLDLMYLNKNHALLRLKKIFLSDENKKSYYELKVEYSYMIFSIISQ